MENAREGEEGKVWKRVGMKYYKCRRILLYWCTVYRGTLLPNIEKFGTMQTFSAWISPHCLKAILRRERRAPVDTFFSGSVIKPAVAGRRKLERSPHFDGPQFFPSSRTVPTKTAPCEPPVCMVLSVFLRDHHRLSNRNVRVGLVLVLGHAPTPCHEWWTVHKR